MPILSIAKNSCPITTLLYTTHISDLCSHFYQREVSVCLTLAQVQPRDFSESLPLLKRQHMKPDWSARGIRITLLLEAASWETIWRGGRENGGGEKTNAVLIKHGVSKSERYACPESKQGWNGIFRRKQLFPTFLVSLKSKWAPKEAAD